MARLASVFLFFFILRASEAIPTYPSGCGVSEEIGSVYQYSCNYATMPNPLVYSTFSDPIPQRLRIYNINGALPKSRTSGFGSFDMNAVSTDFPPKMILKCTVGGSMTLAADTFHDFSYLQELEIFGCTMTTLPSGAFSGITILNKLTIRGGTITTIDANAFNGLDIQPIANYPEPEGTLTFEKVTLTNGIPAALFANLASTRWINLNNLGLTTIDAALFTSVTALRGLSIRDNSLTTLPDTIFDGLKGFSQLDQSNIEWDCTCDNLKFLRTAREQGINIIGAPVCTTGDNADHYYNTTCTTSSICGDTPGIAVGGNCMFLGMLAGLILISIGFIISIIALACVCHLRKKVLNDVPKRGKRAPPPPGSNPKNVSNKGRRGSGWV